jgi:hypothetical protein
MLIWVVPQYHEEVVVVLEQSFFGKPIDGGPLEDNINHKCRSSKMAPLFV